MWQPQPLASAVLVREQGQYGLIFIEELGDDLDRIVPLDELEARLPSVVKNKAVPVVMVCASGGRAARAAVIARKLGYEKAQVLAG